MSHPNWGWHSKLETVWGVTCTFLLLISAEILIMIYFRLLFPKFGEMLFSFPILPIILVSGPAAFVVWAYFDEDMGR